MIFFFFFLIYVCINSMMYYVDGGFEVDGDLGNNGLCDLAVGSDGDRCVSSNRKSRRFDRRIGKRGEIRGAEALCNGDGPSGPSKRHKVGPNIVNIYIYIQFFFVILFFMINMYV